MLDALLIELNELLEKARSPRSPRRGDARPGTTGRPRCSVCSWMSDVQVKHVLQKGKAPGHGQVVERLRTVAIELYRRVSCFFTCGNLSEGCIMFIDPTGSFLFSCGFLWFGILGVLNYMCMS